MLVCICFYFRVRGKCGRVLSGKRFDAFLAYPLFFGRRCAIFHRSSLLDRPKGFRSSNHRNLSTYSPWRLIDLRVKRAIRCDLRKWSLAAVRASLICLFVVFMAYCLNLIL